MTIDEPPYAQAFYAAIGRTIVAWTKLERAIDIIAYSARTIESEEPVHENSDKGFKSKVTAIGRALRTHPPHKKNQKWITQLLASISVAAKRRNIIVHGLSDGFSNTKKPRIRFVSRRYRAGRHTSQEEAFTLTELNTLVSEIQRLDRYLCMLALTTVSAPRRRLTAAPRT